MDFTLTDVLRTWPEGTTVGAYKRSDWGADTPAGTPPAAAGDTAAVTGGAVAFTGLDAGTEYVTAADIAGTWVYGPRFRTDDPASGADLLSYDAGTDTLDIAAANVTADGAPIGAGTEYVTALPADPADGDEVYFGADPANGVVWHLRYRAAAAGSYKWDVLGGPPLSAEVETGQGTTTTGSYVDLATVGPSVTVPLAGVYDVTVEAHTYHSSGSISTRRMSYAIGAAAALDADGFGVQGAEHSIYAARTKRQTIAAAATAIVAKYQHNIAGTGSWINRRMAVRPVRVG